MFYGYNLDKSAHSEPFAVMKAVSLASFSCVSVCSTSYDYVLMQTNWSKSADPESFAVVQALYIEMPELCFCFYYNAYIV